MAACAVVLVAAFVVGSCGSDEDGASRGDGKPSVLLVLSGSSGSFAPEGVTGRAVLVLHDVSPAVILFSDRPERRASQIPVERLIARWSNLFKGDPPNAAVQILKGRRSSDTVVVELREPRYQSRSGDLTLDVRVLEISGGRLGAFADADARLPTRFSDATMFIDSAAISIPFNHPVIE